jgi:uncharacterized OB-fold protein
MSSYLPAGLPHLLPSPDDAPWWEALARRELVIQRCAACGTWRHPPAPVCASCHATAVRWERVSGRGRVFTWTVIHHAVHPALAACVPYNVVVVELPDAAGVRLISNVVDVAPDELRVGLAIEVVFEEQGDLVLARFRRSP